MVRSAFVLCYDCKHGRLQTQSGDLEPWRWRVVALATIGGVRVWGLKRATFWGRGVPNDGTKEVRHVIV